MFNTETEFKTETLGTETILKKLKLELKQTKLFQQVLVCCQRRDPSASSSFVCYALKGTNVIVQFTGPKGTIWRLLQIL